jgi:hypothetical protein
MAVEISSIKNEKLQHIAQLADRNGDGKLKKEEYALFAQEAQAQGVNYESINEALDMNGFQRWWHDVDKISTDGKNDGHLSFGESAKSFLKGLGGGLIKGIIKNPIKSLVGFAAVAGLSVLTGGAILPALAVAGVALGAGTAIVGAVKNAKADNDGDAKRGLETTGTGVATVILSMLGIKAANKAGANAGVKGLQGLDKDNVFVNLGQAIKTMPEQMKMASLNTKGNVLTWASAIKGDKVIYANSNATRRGIMIGEQSGNKVEDAYKVDLRGTVEEVLEKNPGLEYDAEAGKFYVQTSWGEKSYVQNDNYMFIKYGEGDCNAVDGVEFYDTYIDHPKFEATGAKRYIDPKTLEPGQHVETSKNAMARFKIIEPGTKYVGAEGEATVQPGSVLRVDGQGRPYQSTVEFMFKKVKMTPEQMAELAKVDLAQATKTPAGQAFIAQNTQLSQALQRQNAINATAALHVETAKQQQVAQFMKQYPDVRDRLVAVEDANGARLFNDLDIASTFLNCGKTIKTNPEAIYALVENPEFVADAPTWSAGPSFALFKYLYY